MALSHPLGVVYASVPDLLRLLALPAFAWGAYRDVETRRVPDRLWPPLLLLGVGCLAWQGWTVLGTADPFARYAFGVRVAASLLVVGGLGVAFYVVPLGFGGADAKALVAIAVLLPTYPTYYLGRVVLPLAPSNVRIFSLTVLTNALLLGLAYPVYLTCANVLRGRIDPLMAVGQRVPVADLEGVHGSLLEDADGRRFTGGLDLDALRMYCRWRGVSLADLRRDASLRDPATLPDEPNDPTDGVVYADGGETAATVATDDDPWGAAAFLDDIEGSAYGTTPATLRAGLDLITEREAVWVTPGTPFFVSLALGLLVAFTYGDVLFAILGLVGLH